MPTSTPSTAAPPPPRRISQPRGLDRIDVRFIVTFGVLFFSVLVVSISVLFFGVPFSTGGGWIQNEREQAYRTLSRLADMQKGFFEREFARQRHDAKLLTAQSLLADVRLLSVQLSLMERHSDAIQSLRVVERKTRIVVASSMPDEIGSPLIDAPALDGLALTDVDYLVPNATTSDQPYFQVATGYVDADNRPMALVLEYSFAQVMPDLYAHSSNIWHSVDTRIVNEQGRILWPKGNQTQGELPPFYLLSAQGQEGFIETMDEHGRPILAAYRHLRLFPGWSWGLVVKVDQQELLGNIDFALRQQIMIGVVAFVLFLLTAILLTRQLTQPLRNLTAGVSRITSGAWNVRTAIRRKDEVGVLAQAFDSMVEAMREQFTSLETRVAERTSALSAELATRIETEQALRLAKEQAEAAISGHKLAEEYMRRLVNRYEAIIATTQDGFWVVDLDGRIVEVNDAYCRMSGYSRGELMDMSIADLEVHDSPDEIRAHMEQVIHTGGAQFSTRHRKKDGQLVHVEASVSYTRFENDSFVCGFFRDSTHRLMMEEQLRQTHKLEAVGTLAGGIAHDFNNIMAIILSNVELMQIGGETEVSLRDIRDATLRGRDLVRQLLAFGRRHHSCKKPINPIPLLKEVLKLMRSTLPTSITIQEQGMNEPLLVLGDPTQFYQVAVNLCTNGGQAMGEEGGVLTVGLRATALDQEQADLLGIQPGPYCELLVQDTGMGMVPEVQARIFEPFFTTKEQGKGTGLGLSVVHGAVKECGGGIAVSSQLGAGSCFRVYFPRLENPGPVEKPPERTSLTYGAGRILFVDDEPALAAVGEKMLVALGYTVTSFTNPQEALAAFQAAPTTFDAVITDQIMPGMTGQILAQHLLTLRPELPVFLCSGFSEKMNEESAAQAGIRQFFLKPISMNDIGKALHTVLDH